MSTHREAEAVLAYLAAHTPVDGIPPRLITAGNQATFVCYHCGDDRTIDTIKAEANVPLYEENQ